MFDFFRKKDEAEAPKGTQPTRAAIPPRPPQSSTGNNAAPRNPTPSPAALPSVARPPRPVRQPDGDLGQSNAAPVASGESQMTALELPESAIIPSSPQSQEKSALAQTAVEEDVNELFFKPSPLAARSEPASDPESVRRRLLANSVRAGGGLDAAGQPRHLGALLLENRYCNERQLHDALEIQRQTSELLGQILVREGCCTSEQILECVAKSGVSSKDDREILTRLGARPGNIRAALMRVTSTGESLLDAVNDFGFLPAEVMAKAQAIKYSSSFFPFCNADSVDNATILEHNLIPSEQNYVPVTYDPVTKVIKVLIFSSKSMQDAKNQYEAKSCRIEFVFATEATVTYIYRRNYAKSEVLVDEMITEFRNIVSKKEDIDKQSGLVQRVLAAFLRHACYQNASDIYFHPTPAMGHVELRVDGVKHVFRTFPMALYERMISKLSMLASVQAAIFGVEFADSALKFEGEERDLYFKEIANRYGFRAVFGPSKHGPTVTLRILDQQSNIGDFRSLGFDPTTQSRMVSYTQSGHGLVFVTGPTGSGKTTTLYSNLNLMDPEATSIQTVEDPAEYIKNLWKQYQLSTASNAPKGAAQWNMFLKGLLRNAPNVILFGEVRDADTAEVLTSAALTGHLVYSTLHTNDAAGAIDRLRNLGISNDHLAQTLLGILAQRLVRRVCQSCAEPEDRQEYLALLEKHRRNWDRNVFGNAECRPLKAGAGCKCCNYLGYRGRTMLYELLHVTSAIRLAIESGSPTSRIQEMMRSEGGGRDLVDCGIMNVARGITTFDEVQRQAKGSILDHV